MSLKEYHSFLALVSGGAAGTAVDISLYPLDTIKTRLQSNLGFKASGGFRSLYNGLGPVALGSAPNAAIFFLTYESVKKHLRPIIPSKYVFIGHALAATAGEVVACLVRVPVEVVKQRRQTRSGISSLRIAKSAILEEGVLGLYRGYWSTLFREIPFSFIQYPLWELIKEVWGRKQGRDVEPWQSSVSGAVAGGFAAAITTPLDVAKTRIMLAEKGSEEAQGKISVALKSVYRKSRWKGLFAGVVPRTMWMSLGGAIYFGVYEKCKSILSGATS